MFLMAIKKEKKFFFLRKTNYSIMAMIINIRNNEITSIILTILNSECENETIVQEIKRKKEIC